MSVQDFAAAGITFRDATVADAKDLNELYNSIIGEETSLEWNEKRPLAEHEFYLDWMIQNDYPCILVYEGDVLIGYGSLERWIVGDGGSFPGKHLCALILRCRGSHQLLHGKILHLYSSSLSSKWYSSLPLA